MAVSINGSTNVITGVAVGGLPDGIVDADMLASNAVTSGKLASGVGGKILQVKQTFKNDTASTNSGTYAAISGLTVSITPSSSSNKILYRGCLYLAGSGSESVFRLTRTVGGSATEIATPSTFADDEDGTFAHGGGSRYAGHSFEFLDSPNTTSAITYGIKWQVHSGTTYLNRTWDANWFHGVSSVTAMEVSA